MRRLLLLRHSKAAPPVGREDYARALTGRGREDANKVGSLIAGRGFIPDLVVHSSAERTRETAELVARQWPAAVRRLSEQSLYEAPYPLILKLIRQLPADAACVMIVGHNPGMCDIANQLAGESADFDRHRMAAQFPTSGLAVLDFDGETWADVRPREARLVAFVAAGDAGA